jgi:putative ABC transport system permease protein
MKASKNQAPKWPRRLLVWYCGETLAEDLIGDVEELFYLNLSRISKRKARFKYCLQSLSILFSHTIAVRKRNKNRTKRSTQNYLPMYKNYFKVAFRSLIKHKLFTIINVIGLAFGMSIGLLAVSALVDMNSVDDFHANKDRIYRVVSHTLQPKEDLASVPEPMGIELVNLQAIEQVVRISKKLSGEVPTTVSNIPIYGYFADANFFDVFDYTLSSGNKVTALRDPFSIVISQETSAKFFHGKDPLGEPFEIEGVGTFKITGVLDISPRSHFLFEALGSYSTIPLISSKKALTNWNDLSASFVYLLLKEKAEVEQVNQSLMAISDRTFEQDKSNYATFELQRLDDIPFGYKYNNETGMVWGWPVMILFFAISFMILTPACFNYANLSISRALKRSKEIGLRKVVGGQKSQIISQFLLEACLITLVSLLGAIFIFTIIREEFLSMIVNGRESFSLQLDLLTIIAFILFALLAGGIAGIAPALYFSRLNPLETLRAASTPSRLKKFNLRKILTVGQFALSLFFIMGIAIIIKQYKFALNYNFGFDKENVLDVQLNGVDYQKLSNEFQKIPEVQNMSFSSHVAGTHTALQTYVVLPEINDSTAVFQMFVDREYIPNMNIELLAGQNFPEIQTSGESFIIVNEKFLKKFQIESPLDAVDKEFNIEGKLLRVRGVVKDFNFLALREDIDAFFFRDDPEKYGYANLRILTTDINQTLEKLETSWLSIAEERRFNAAFMEDELEEALVSFQSFIKIFGGLGLLAIIISCLGLLGMVVFTIENKIKEVGVKKVMGASVSQLVLDLSADFIKLLLYASIITVPIAYFMFDRLFLRMQHFRDNIGALEIIGSILILFTLGVITIMSQTIKAARKNPVDSLRYE